MGRRTTHAAMAALTLLTTSALGAPAAIAAPQNEEALAETIRRQGEIIRALERRIEALEGKTAPVASLQPPAPAATTIRVRGRLHADSWAVLDGASGTELRRARLGAEGKLNGTMPYVVEVDFAGNSVSLQDAFLDLPLGERTAVRLGYHKVPFSLDDQTSDNYNLFMEHPVGVSPFVPGRGVAAAVVARGENWFAHGGVFGEGEDDSRDGLADENLTLGGRLAWAPILTADHYLHLAIAGYGTTLNNASAVRFRERPERHLSPYLVDTGLLSADNLLVLGIEAAASSGPLGVAAEYAHANVQDPAGGERRLGGQSVEIWWNLTGEGRPYNINGATFGRIAPKRPVEQGGWGLWQLAARYSGLDLDDGPVRGGTLNTASLGLNWHLTSHARLMLTLNRSVAERVAGNLEQTAIGGRVQIDW